MKIVLTLKDKDLSPYLGASPTITISDITDFSSVVTVVISAPLQELGGGFYGDVFDLYQQGHEYSV